MTNEEAKKKLKAKHDCLKRDISGKDKDCNFRRCDECGLCYEQGNMGEQLEALDIAIKALEQSNNFEEVVDFFNDIMDTLYKDFAPYNISTESVRYARNRVYDVFSRRYRIKELESNIAIKENERNEKN